MRLALAYVRVNARRHRVPVAVGDADLLSSGAWFTGWRNLVPIPLSSHFACPLATARTWLLRKGWRARGLLDVDAVPG